VAGPRDAQGRTPLRVSEVNGRPVQEQANPGGCFAADVRLRTPDGDKPVQDFKPDDLIVSRPEGNREAPLEVQRVEAVFVRMGRIFRLGVQGKEIKTTGEHPFYVRERGWVQANELRVGDLLASHDGQWVPVDAVLDTGEYETVYNLRVANYHTYFVGSRAWGFSVWAHNAPCTAQAISDLTEGLPAGQAERLARIINGELPGTRAEVEATLAYFARGTTAAERATAAAEFLDRFGMVDEVPARPGAPQGPIPDYVDRHINPWRADEVYGDSQLYQNLGIGEPGTWVFVRHVRRAGMDAPVGAGSNPQHVIELFRDQANPPVHFEIHYQDSVRHGVRTVDWVHPPRIQQ
jgi:hypothetical protein